MAGLLFAGALAAAAPGSFDRPWSGERLAPGRTVLASWSLDAEAVRDMDEAELVLSLDDGLTYPVRLTGRIPPDARAAQWRVPALSTEHARIALRAGRDEETEEEELLLVSDPFSIAAPASQSLDELFAVSEEWRTREALEGAPARSPSSTCQAPGPAIEADPLAPVDADEARRGDAPAFRQAATRATRNLAIRPMPIPVHGAFCPADREAAAPLRL